MRDGKVIGVAYIGSRTAHEFSEEDMLLFRSTVSRATSAIVKGQILADLRRAEAGQRFLADASRELSASLDVDATLAKIAHLAVPIVGRPPLCRPATRRLELASGRELSGSRAAGAAKGVSLRGPAITEGVSVLADRRRLLQVMANVVGNAIKFTPAGGVITIGAEVHPAEVIVSVRDTGPGIPAEQRTEIFEPYRTIRREGTTGTGLGLYIAKGIVSRHGGRMWVESEVGGGSTFFFTLPRGDR